MQAKEVLRTRNVGVRRVRVADLDDAPWNFRTHPQSQRDALAGAIDEIGFFGTPEVYETEGRLRLIDGHLRKSLLVQRYGADTEIDVCVTDFSEAEAKFATLTKDPIAAMAEADAAKLDALLREVETSSQELAAMLTELAEENGIVPGDEKSAPEDFAEMDESIETEHKCPKCGYQWSGGE